MRYLLILALVWLLPAVASAQSTLIQTSGTLPSTCSVGAIYAKTGASAGFYVCLATDTWTGPLAGSADIQTLLDGISTTQGVVLYYNGTDWVALGTGTNGHFLQTQGAGANPQWAAAAGGGDVTGPGSTVDGEIALFDGTSGDLLKSATGTGFVTASSGVMAAYTLESVIGITIDGGGSAITTGVKGYVRVPWACTITSAVMLADQSTSSVVDVWVDTLANYPPTDADSITASAPPTITTDTDSEDGTLTGWTTTVAAGAVAGFTVDSNDNAERLTLELPCTRTF